MAKRKGRAVLAVVVGTMLVAAAGVAGGIAIAQRADDRTETKAATNGRTLAPTPTPGVNPRTEAPAALGPAAPTPEAAVRAYLDAEIARDRRASFAQLSASDRRATASVAAWSAAHRELPEFTGYTVEQTTPQVVTTVTATPRVDEIVGVIAGRARITWSTVNEDGGARIALGASRYEPLFPAEAGAVNSALEWVTQRQRCAKAVDYGGSLLGNARLADDLCKITGTFKAGPVKTLDAFAGASTVISAFGPDAGDWARVVALSGPGQLHVLTAPLGDRWIVVGVSGTLKQVTG